MTLTVKHATLTGAAANPDVLVDGPSWDASHTITGIMDAAQMPALTGDVTSSAGAVATTLATVNSNIGTFGSATQTAQITVNGKGLATAAANVTITPAIGSVTGLGTGVSTFLATPSSANLRAALTDEVGTGAAYFVGGALGTPASGTLTSCTGLPLSSGISGAGTGVLAALAVNVGSAGAPVLFNGALGTPSSGTLTSATGLPISTGVSGLGTGVAAFLATPSSANLATALTDETGTGSAVFATSPTITTPNVVGAIPTTATVTITIASPGVITWAAHGLTANAPVYFVTTGALPTGLTAAAVPAGTLAPNTYSANPTLYYVVGSSITTNTFQVATSIANAIAGTAVNTSGSQSGTHTAFANAMAPAGTVGELIWSLKDTVTGVALGATATNTVWNSINLTAGIWKVWAQSGIIGTPFGGASTFSCQHMHANYGVGITSISSAPYNGAAALHVQTSNSNGWIIDNPANQIVVTTTSTVNAVMLVDYTAGAAIAYGGLFALRVH